MAKTRPTKAQMKRLVELVSNDPQLAAGKFCASFTHKKAVDRWQKISDELNSLPGAEKTHFKWKKAWQDTRGTAKAKAAAIKRHINGTGGGPPCDITFSEAQADTLPLISQVAVSGHSSCSESIVNFDMPHLKINSAKNNSSSFKETKGNLIDCTTINLENVPVYVINEEEEEEVFTDFDQEVLAENQQSIEQPMDEELVMTPPENLIKKKRTSATERLQESNDVAQRMTELTAKKIELKSVYYSKKLKLMEENNNILNNINILLTSYITTKLSDTN